MKFSEKDIRIFRGVSLVAGIFTLVIAFTMLFTLIQLKTINPLDTPSMKAIKDQFDSDPENRDKAEQVRTIDLMARRAYFSSRWQVETGSYLLLAGALVFVVFQRLIAGSEKPLRNLYPDKPNIDTERIRNRKILIISGCVVTITAVISSFILRSELPASGNTIPAAIAEVSPPVIQAEAYQPGDVNYPFFRGEGSRGIARGSDYPTEWDAQGNKNIKWKIAVPKPGKSSPVIWGDKLYLTGAGDGGFDIYCIDKNSGKVLWNRSGSDFPGSSKDEPESDQDAGMAVPTAAVNEDGVYAIFGNGNLACYDHEGKLVWAKNIGVPQVTYGFSSSLLIFQNILIVQYDSQNKLAISGFDLKTGDQKWETTRPGRAVNSSPVLASFNGQPQVLVNGNPNVSAYDPVEGKELWSLPGVSGDVAPSVAVNSKMVFTAVDYFNVVAIIPGKNGSTAWQDNTFTPDVSSPVANESFLFVTTGNGDAACYNAQTGDTLWSHYFQNPFYASPVICDNKVYMLDRTGTMHITDAAGKLKVISSSPLGESTDCTPAFSEKRIYIRGKTNLYCIGSN
jgi:outer membrane protein assembly factor BamB